MKERLIERLRLAAEKNDTEHLLISFRVQVDAVLTSRKVVGDAYAMDCIEALNKVYIEERMRLYQV